MVKKMGLALVVAGALLAGGCRTGRMSAGIVLDGGGEARVVVLGSRPYVEIRNAGPDSVWVDMKLSDHAEGQELYAGNALGRGTSHGPIEVGIKADEGASATIEIRAQRASGLKLENPVNPQGK